MAEIDAQISEERNARKGLGLKEAFFGKGSFIRFVIAFTIFSLQQWGGQNTVGWVMNCNMIVRRHSDDFFHRYYAPSIFASVRHFTFDCSSLLRYG
jgi:hypothetical protein